MHHLVFLASFIIILCGCNSPEIKNDILNDRVKACSAGFSEDTQGALHASLNKAALDGGLTADVKRQTQSIIFLTMPDGDKLKAYEDYIQCIEKNWNGNG